MDKIILLELSRWTGKKKNYSKCNCQSQRVSEKAVLSLYSNGLHLQGDWVNRRSEE